MNFEEYIKLGFSSKEEMELFTDVFGGQIFKEAEPASLEELLKSLKSDKPKLVSKTKEDLIKEINDETKYPRLGNVSLKTLLELSSKVSIYDRLCAIYAYYQTLSKKTTTLYDRSDNYYRNAESLYTSFYNQKESMTEEQQIQYLMSMNEQLRDRYAIGQYRPYFELATNACDYISLKVQTIFNTETQERFFDFASSLVEPETQGYHHVTKRDMAFVEAMSRNGRIMREQIQDRQNRRYEEMTNEANSMDIPTISSRGR